MGYSSTQKNYRLYNMLIDTCFVSMDVYFKDRIFPFQLLKEGKLHLLNGAISNTDIPRVAATTKEDLLDAVTPSHPSSPAVDIQQDSVGGDLLQPSGTSTLEHYQDHIEFTLEDIANNRGNEQLRKSARTTKEPIWMQDYVCDGTSAKYSAKNACIYPLQEYLCHRGISANFQIFLSKFIATKEPISYEEAMTDPRWVEAIDQECKWV